MAQGLCSACQWPGLGLDSWPWGPALDSPPVYSPKTPSPSVEGPSDLGENHKWALSVRSGWTEIRATCLLPRGGRGLKGHPLSCYWLPPTPQQSGLDVRIRPCLSRLQTPRLLTHSSEIPAAPLALSRPPPSSPATHARPPHLLPLCCRHPASEGLESTQSLTHPRSFARTVPSAWSTFPSDVPPHLSSLGLP